MPAAIFFSVAEKKVVSSSGEVRTRPPFLRKPFRLGCVGRICWKSDRRQVRSDDLSSPILAETIDGRLIDEAVPLIEKHGFKSADDAREHVRNRRAVERATKESGRSKPAINTPAAPPPDPPSSRRLSDRKRNPRSLLRTMAAISTICSALRKACEIQARSRPIMLGVNRSPSSAASSHKGNRNGQKEVTPPNSDHRQLGSRVRDAMAEHDLSQVDVAQQIDVSSTTISRFLSGRYKGDNEKVASKLAVWLETLAERQESLEHSR